MTQTEFQAAGGALSQTNTILAELKSNAGEWVPMPHLALTAQCFSVRSRIDELRKKGHRIENSSKRDMETRKVHSYYRLVPASVAPVIAAPVGEQVMRPVSSEWIDGWKP